MSYYFIIINISDITNNCWFSIAPPLIREIFPTTKKSPSYRPYRPVSFPVTFLKTSIIEYTSHTVDTSTSRPTPSKSEVNTTAAACTIITVLHEYSLWFSAALFITCMLKDLNYNACNRTTASKKCRSVSQIKYDDIAITT